MSLSAYNKKRNFRKTGEPEGKKKTSRRKLRFVVQKHDASSVHYDFRLEMEGVLKSWAVPKGPSLNPSDKRLAMMVEDHPFSYRNFEGIIPAGEYGGGTVIVWDEGTYEPATDEKLPAKEKEEWLLQRLEDGKLSVVLHGQKLKGEFTIFKMKNRTKNAWMLVKKKDDWSDKADITKNEASVQSGKTLAEVALEHGTTLNHPATTGKKNKKTTSTSNRRKRQPPKKASAGKKAGNISPETKKILGSAAKKAERTTIPFNLQPMMATLIDEPFDDTNWIFEVKWDGYRALAYCNGGDVKLQSRNQKSFTKKYAPVAEALETVGIEAVLDGEIVAVDSAGMADFQALQNWQNSPGQLQYFVFDLLWVNGTDITRLPLVQRKQLLQKIIPANNETVKYSDHVTGNGKDFFNVAVKKGLEGIMAKLATSLYQAGTRTQDWAKIKVSQRQEVVIAGYTEPRGSRKYFGSLLLGVYEGNELLYVGHTGSGFNAKSLKEIYQKLKPLKRVRSPFAQTPKTNMPATWVKPSLVCEIKFTEWTADRQARHAIFMGLREDKKPTDVKLEKTTPMAKVKTGKKAVAPKKTPTKRKTKRATKSKSVSGKKVNVEEGDAALQLDGNEVSLTNLEKVYWPKEAFRKGDLVNYYLQMAPYILPYLLDRPQSLNRHPNGIKGPHFYQKDVGGKVPDWIETFKEFSESTNKAVDYLVCTGESSLIYMANLGCIEMNPWHARTGSHLNPDWCLIDLDPDKTNTFDEVIAVANKVHEALESIGVVSGVKTSGSTGIHIYIPLGAKYNFEESKNFAESLVSVVNAALPQLTSMERSPSKRKGKIYLDYLQNSETQTAAAPYSLRPKPGVPVSAPLDWSEVKKGLTITMWNAKNIYERVKSEGDLFAPVLGKGIDLKNAIKKLESLRP